MSNYHSVKITLACLLTTLLSLSMGGARLHAQDPNLDPTFGSVSLKADFLPDPFEKKLVAGGLIKTNLGGVNAYVAKAPDFRLHYTAGAYTLTIHVVSRANTTLLIKLPDGTWIADDDSGGNLNPLIRLKTPPSGRFDIYVGTIGKDYAEATLKITEREVRLADDTGRKPKKDPLEEEVLSRWYQALDFEKQDRYQEAAALYERILPTAERIYGKDDARTATILFNLANMYRNTIQYAKAESHYLRGLQIYEASLGKDHPKVATALNNMAILYSKMGHYAKAEPLYQRSLEIRETKLGKDHPDVAQSLNNLGLLYSDMGQYARAESTYHHSLRISEARLGKDHPDVAQALNNLALLYREIGQYAKAEPLYDRSLQISEAKLGKDHPDVARSLNNLASLYYAMGQSTKAEPLLQRSLQILEGRLGKDHPLVAQSLNNLAILYNHMGQYARAESLYQRSLQISEARLGKDHPEVASSLNNLAKLYDSIGQYAKALPLYQRSLQIHEAKLGKDHPDTATSLNNLALLYSNMGQDAKAQPLYQRGLQVRETTLGKDHPDVATSLNHLAWNLALQKEWVQAVGLIQKAQRGTLHHLADVLPILSEKEQLTFLKDKFERRFHTALSLGWSARPEAIAPSAAWLLNGKAIVHQSLAEQHILARDARDPRARQLVTDLQRTRASLAAHINRMPKTGMEKEYQQELQQLKTGEQDLAQKVARAVGRPYRANPWIALEDLRARLGPKTTFVDIARFELIDFNNNKKIGPRYVAWITPPQGKGNVQLIDLGPAEPIDQLVKQTRNTLLESAKAVTKLGELEAAVVLQKPLQELSAKVLHPLLPMLEKYEEWIVCPDGALWLTPWNALLLPDGKFVVERHLIHHVVSGRDLVLELPKQKAESAYLFADPDYDLSPVKGTATAGGLRVSSELNLLGQRLHGSIDTWKVSFEFQENEVLIHDEQSKGTVVGKASWKLQDNTLTMQTSISRFEGSIEPKGIRGQRSKRNDDGTTTTDHFHMELPREAKEESRSAGSALTNLRKVLRLPSTALEVEAVRPRIQQWLGQEPKLFLEEKANKTMVKSVKNPRVLTLATHGYFLPTQEIELKERPGMELGEGKRLATLVDKKGQPFENPLLRCGLFLAGCNKRGDVQAGQDDGILTGLEIVGMELNGCELVVLSACETGLGDVRNGEGVAGLRQAFQLAGAKAVLASLWQVPDFQTALLMNAFYGELAKGRSQADALRQAQLQRIASRREQFGVAHPFFWAAFTLTSRGTD